MLEIRSLTKRYNGIAAVENITFRIDKGRMVADDAIERLRDRLHEESLEGVFAQLTSESRTDEVADRILEAMQA